MVSGTTENNGRIYPEGYLEKAFDKVKSKSEYWFNSNKQRNTLLIIVGILGIILFMNIQSCNRLKNELAISNQNNKALADSMRISENKVGDLESSKNVLISKKKDLENLNKSLADELKKEKGKVYGLNQYILSIENKPADTVFINNTLIKYANGEFGLDWKYDTIFNNKNGREFAGISKFKIKDSTITPTQTIITKDKVYFNLVTGLREKDGNIEIFARSDYPGFKIVDLEGAIIDPKKNPVIKKFTEPKKWCVGPYIGVGVSNSLQPSVQIGVGIQYSIIKF
jgi:hypothetical protein